MTTIQIGDRKIGPGHPVYVIAELSANHNGSFEDACALVRVAKESGADAVKLQTYTADTITIDSREPAFMIKGTVWDGQNLHALYGEASMPWDWQPRLKALADEIGIAIFSSPFDSTSVDFLEEMGVPAYKIASFELIDHGLLARVAATGKPVIMSTGMATLTEITEAVEVLRAHGCRELALLKCTSAYPAPPEEANLRTIRHLSETFGVPAGLSDHTLGIAIPAVAVALGASLIEKHFTLSRAAGGPDSAFSLEPQELADMITAAHAAEKAVGGISYQPTAKEVSHRAYRRSLFAVRDIAAGEPLTEENVRSIRPGHGLAPKHLGTVLGRQAKAPIKRGTPLSWDLLAS